MRGEGSGGEPSPGSRPRANARCAPGRGSRSATTEGCCRRHVRSCAPLGKVARELQLIFDVWPELLRDRGVIDLAERRNRLLRRLAERWKRRAAARLHGRCRNHDGGAGSCGARRARRANARGDGRPSGPVAGATSFPTKNGMRSAPMKMGEAKPPIRNIHLKLLLDRLGVARGEVQLWRRSGRQRLPRRRGAGGRQRDGGAGILAQMGNAPAGRAASRRHSRGRTLRSGRGSAGDRARVAGGAGNAGQDGSACHSGPAARRRGCRRFSSAGASKPTTVLACRSRQPLLGHCCWRLPRPPPRSLRPSRCSHCSSIRWSAVRATNALEWLEAVRSLDLELRGPRPPAGLAGLDAHFARSPQWHASSSPSVEVIDGRLREAECAKPVSPRPLSEAVESLAGDSRVARARTGEWRRICSPNCRHRKPRAQLTRPPRRCGAAASSTARGTAPFGRLMEDIRESSSGACSKRGCSARISSFSAASTKASGRRLPAPDPWLPPKVRASSGMPTLEFRIGLAAHDFASALGAPEVLITRARRDAKSPTIASRFLLRLEAISGGLPRDVSARAVDARARRSWTAAAGRSARAVAADRTAARQDLGHGSRSAEGRSVRLLRAGDPQASHDGSGRCRPYGAVEGR